MMSWMMSSSLWAVHVILLSALLSRVTAQAPGDGEKICVRINAESSPTYPHNAKILMDSYNYFNLLTTLNPFSSHWQQVDNNNTTRNDGFSVNWFQGTALGCRQTMSVCGFAFGNQDNWLITQHISRVVNGTRVPQVSVLLEFEFKGCNVNGCQRTFTLNAWETSDVDPTAARRTVNYGLINRVAPIDESGQSKQNQTSEIDFKTDEDGFYLAIQDESTCIALLRVIVFYHVCPGSVFHRVIRPETLAPRIDRLSKLVEVTTVCVVGASPENGVTAKLICAQGGVWNAVAGSGCRCNSGLVDSGDGQSCIEGCPASQYLSKANNDECLKCPANSMSEVSGLSVCPCVMGYYRKPEEIDLECTNQSIGPSTTIAIAVSTVTIAVVSASLLVVVFCLCYIRIYKQKTRRISKQKACRRQTTLTNTTDDKSEVDVAGEESLLYNLPKSLIISPSEIQVSTVIGQGEFGVIYKGYLKSNMMDVAIKTLKGIFATASDIESLSKEIEKMQYFDHLNVMSLIGVCMAPSEQGGSSGGPCIVMPFMAKGSLLDQLRKESDELKVISEDDKNIHSATASFKDLVTVAQQLHKQNRKCIKNQLHKAIADNMFCLTKPEHPDYIINELPCKILTHNMLHSKSTLVVNFHGVITSFDVLENELIVCKSCD